MDCRPNAAEVSRCRPHSNADSSQRGVVRLIMLFNHIIKSNHRKQFAVLPSEGNESDITHITRDGA